MTERICTIHREGIDRFTAIVDGEEVVAVRAADYDAMETARDMLGRELDEAEAELAHIKQSGWQKAQDEHNALRAQLAEAQEELAQWRATGESVTRNEHDLAARLAEAERGLDAARVDNNQFEQANEFLNERINEMHGRLAEAEALLLETIPAVQSYARKHGRAVVAAARRNDADHAAKHADIENRAWSLADKIRAFLALKKNDNA